MVYAQKLTTPEEIRKIARPTKRGPAAPVTRSAIRSRNLKQRNTAREHIVMDVVDDGEGAAWSDERGDVQQVCTFRQYFQMGRELPGSGGILSIFLHIIIFSIVISKEGDERSKQY